MRFLFLLHHSVCHERMGVMQLSAIARARGHETRLCYVTTYRSFAALIASVRAYRPDVLCYSLMSGETAEMLAVNRRLRAEVEALSIAGGPHVTFHPACLEEEHALDAICVGEGDGAFADLCDRYPDGDWRSIENFFVREVPGALRRNPVRPLVEDLDALPLPDREIMVEASPHLAREDSRLFFAGRGCPHRCSYCFNLAQNRIYRGKGSVVRYRSVAHLVGEIAGVGRRCPSMRYVCLDDDMFLLKPADWLEELACAMEPLAYRIICNVRPDAVTDESIGRLRRAGLFAAWMGVECGDEEVARKVLGRNITNAEILAAAAILKRHGVRIVTTNLMCLPVPDPLAADRKTIDLNRRIRPAFAWSSVFHPYPGTEIGRYCREHGFLAGSEDGRAVLAANRGRSALRFPRAGDGEKGVRVQHLFGVLVELRLPWRLIRLLLRLPLSTFYLAIFYLWYGYCSYFRIRPGARLGTRLHPVKELLVRFSRGR